MGAKRERSRQHIDVLLDHIGMSGHEQGCGNNASERDQSNKSSDYLARFFLARWTKNLLRLRKLPAAEQGEISRALDQTNGVRAS
ncbi:MAG TPA: hypothetical protein VKK61_01080 [Tepidisphaeraceae bacterium]|nr:hypothetical protein [Tepidisphaeraceae bacterium]